MKVARSRNSFGFIKLLILLFGVLVPLGIGVFVVGRNTFLKKVSSPQVLLSTLTTGKTQDLPSKATTNRITGDAGDDFPYGETKEEGVFEFAPKSYGGSLRADLAQNIVAYLVVPPGYSHGESYQMTAYYSMPTSKNAPPLPTDLGFGLDFSILDSHFDSIAPLYLVFDLDQGKTIEKIMKDPKRKHYCAPSLPSFNPAICAYLNNVPMSDHTSNKYGVVTPIRAKEHTDLMFMNSTIPIGYDSLLVVQIVKNGTYIPVKLSSDLLTDLVKANDYGFTYPTLEALVHAMNNDLFFDPNGFPEHFKTLDTDMNAFDTQKAIHMYPKFKPYLEKVLAEYNKNENNKDYPQALSGYIENEIKEADDGEQVAREKFMEYAIEKAENANTSSVELLTMMGQIRRLEEEGDTTATEIRKQMVDKTLKEAEYWMGGDNVVGYDNYYMMSTAMWGSPEIYTHLKREGNSSLLSQIYAYDAVHGGIISSFLGWLFGDVLNNPNATPEEIYEAWRNAVDEGDAARAKDLMDKLNDELLKRLMGDHEQTMEEVLVDMAKAQATGLADEACVNELYQKKSQNALKRGYCVWVESKNLQNFARQETVRDCKWSNNHEYFEAHCTPKNYTPRIPTAE